MIFGLQKMKRKTTKSEIKKRRSLITDTSGSVGCHHQEDEKQIEISLKCKDKKRKGQYECQKDSNTIKIK